MLSDNPRKDKHRIVFITYYPMYVNTLIIINTLNVWTLDVQVETQGILILILAVDVALI